MNCPKCKSNDLNYDGSGLICGACNYALENVSELQALTIAFRKKSKKNQIASYNKKIQETQVRQSQKKYFHFRYYVVE